MQNFCSIVLLGGNLQTMKKIKVFFENNAQPNIYREFFKGLLVEVTRGDKEGGELKYYKFFFGEEMTEDGGEVLF